VSYLELLTYDMLEETKLLLSEMESLLDVTLMLLGRVRIKYELAGIETGVVNDN
jgi:hypothetical protein